MVSSAPRLVRRPALNCTPTTPTLSEALALRFTAVPDTVAPLAGSGEAHRGFCVINGDGHYVEVLELPAESRASAVSVWLPLADWVVSHNTAVGQRWCPRRPGVAPSSLNCTPTTPTLSEALARQTHRPPTPVRSAP